MMKFFPVGIALGALSLWITPAHAGKGGLILDLIQVGSNAIDGTIPRPFVIGFGVLILAIVILAVMEGRKNARKAAEEAANPPESTSGIVLTKPE